MKNNTTKIRNTASTVFIPVLATIFVPISRLDASQEADQGKAFVADIVRDSDLALGGVPVTVICHCTGDNPYIAPLALRTPAKTHRNTIPQVIPYGCVLQNDQLVADHEQMKQIPYELLLGKDGKPIVDIEQRTQRENYCVPNESLSTPKNNTLKTYIKRELTLVGIDPKSLRGRIAIQTLTTVAELEGQTSQSWVKLHIERLGRLHSRSH